MLNNLHPLFETAYAKEVSTPPSPLSMWSRVVVAAG
jgi:hypothetical protein